MAILRLTLAFVTVHFWNAVYRVQPAHEFDAVLTLSDFCLMRNALAEKSTRYTKTWRGGWDFFKDYMTSHILHEE